MARLPHRAALLSAAAALTLAATAVAADVAPEAPDALLGTWRNVAPDDGRAAIARAIDEGVEPMGPLKESIARRKLLENNPPIPRLVIAQAGRVLEVRFGHTHVYRAPLGGHPMTCQSPDGGDVKVTHQLRGDTLVERTSTSKGGSTMLLAPTPNGHRLHITMTIQSPHLPGPIRYRLEMKRAE